MSIIGQLSLILYAAVHTGQSCENVFIEAVKRERPVISQSDMMQLRVLSEAACRSSNPDIIWQIAYQESSFRFDIVRINTQGKEQVLSGQKAHSFLQNLKRSQEKINVDIGVMQINWHWHRQHFDHDPISMLNPEKQVQYIMNHLTPKIVQRCADDWVGCYHHPSNRYRAKSYQKKVLGKSKSLAVNVVQHMQSSLTALAAESKRGLPPIRKEQFYQTLERSLQMNPPEDLELATIGQLLAEMENTVNY